MIQNVLRHLGGIEVYGIISILLFFAAFLGVLVWTFTRSKSDLDAASRLPLDGPAAADTKPTSTPKADRSHE